MATPSLQQRLKSLNVKMKANKQEWKALKAEREREWVEAANFGVAQSLLAEYSSTDAMQVSRAVAKAKKETHHDPRQ
jgi:hypothetical protein